MTPETPIWELILWWSGVSAAVSLFVGAFIATGDGE